MSSSAKKTPAMGALNVAEIPAAVPQATSRRNRFSDTCSTCPIEEPSAEPICTIGPSRPTDPPAPMQIAEASDLTDGHLRTDLSAPLGDGEHDFGDAMSSSFRREELDQWAVDEATDNGRENDEIDAEPRHVRD